MSQIETFQFNENGFSELKQHHRGLDWPVVYIIEDGKEAYVGETVHVYNRGKEHYKNPEREKLKKIHIITDNTYNKSAILDMESSLIQHMAADGVLSLQNSNSGLKEHSYYNREEYQAKFKGIWDRLKEKKLASRELWDIENSDLFKYSPYKSLTEDQNIFVEKIFEDIKNEKAKTYIVSGQPGTGKTVLATYLVKYLKEHKDTRDLKIALVIPMSALSKTIKKVFRSIKGLSAKMVIIANDVSREDYDLVIVDEAHRLKRRRNLGSTFGTFDDVNKQLGLDKEATQIDWIIKRSKHQVFFYDKNQSVVRTDVRPEQFENLKDVLKYDLTTQLRVKAGNDYINFIDDLLNVRKITNSSNNHDLKLFSDIGEMVNKIKERDSEMGLCRMVAGFAWPWLSNPKKVGLAQSMLMSDIDIEGYKLRWNGQDVDWVNSPNAINEVGCIHTTQGYDLNYVGVIIGSELRYDPDLKIMYVDRANYHDKRGFAGVKDDEELKRYIINIYKTLLTRGINGTYIYVVDDNLRKYFEEVIAKQNIAEDKKGITLDMEFSMETVMVPLVGSAPCGEPILAIENIENEIAVDKAKIKSGFEYFILRAEGDSMNLAGIQDDDLILCRKQQNADNGDRVIALLGDHVTVKVLDKNSERVVLLPKSDNLRHQPIVLSGSDGVVGVVQEVLNI